MTNAVLCIFFSTFCQRTIFLDEVVKIRLPRAAPTIQNFNSRKVNTVLEYREELIICMEKIIYDESIKYTPTIEQASGLKIALLDKIFIYQFTDFHSIKPHIDILYNQLQKRKIDSTTVKNDIDNFIRFQKLETKWEHYVNDIQYKVIIKENTEMTN